MRPSSRVRVALVISTALAACGGGDGGGGGGGGPDGGVIPPGETGVALVFVSRQIEDQGSVYWDAVKDMPGVGAHSRVRPAAPGKLLVRDADGTIRTLVDGAAPTAASLQLIDVNGPAVSYDGTTIAFAGLPAGDWPSDPAHSVGGWRIYEIGADGSGLHALTTSDLTLDYGQFGDAAGGLQGYDDYDPVFLPDGRLAFSSTRWPEFGQYSGVRASNLYVVNADGGGMHRITSERNGADRALVDPQTGKLVYARWWRNHRFPVDDMSDVLVDPADASKGYVQHLGLTTARDNPVGGPSMFRNAWQIASIAPDGTGLVMWSGSFRDEEANHWYGGSFAADGSLYANFFPMYNMTEAAGFGGVRHYARGADRYTPVAGVTSLTLDYVSAAPVSYGIFTGTYFGEPEVLPDGRVVVSMASGIEQDYGLYVMDADGGHLAALYDLAGTSELRARVLAARPLAPILPDAYRDDPGSATIASALPPPAAGPYDGDGHFTFRALNIYANGPVDADIVSAPAVGSAATIRFFIDHQRQSPGSFPALDWPIQLGEAAVAADGAVAATQAPAFVPLFEQLRSAQPAYAVPLTGLPDGDGAAHVAGLNYGAAGATARCLGCHAGHTQIAVPTSDEAARWSNLAPGAAVNVTSSRDAQYDTGLIDRRVAKGEIWREWTSATGQASGQAVTLTFPVDVTVRTVRLYNPRQGDEASSTLQVAHATVRLYSDAAGTVEVASASASDLALTGTDVAFADVGARVVRVELDQVTGTFYGAACAGLAEVEVIAHGGPP